MSWIQDTLLVLMMFLEKGGVVVQIIMVLALVLWLMMLERSWFMGFEAKKQMQLGFRNWQAMQHPTTWQAKMVRDEQVSVLKMQLSSRLTIIRSFVAVMPLMGLLGTVSGMIQVFDVMAEMGTGNARAMAAGISRATIPTMAGIVVALTSLYFITRLEILARRYGEDYRLMLLHNVEDVSEISHRSLAKGVAKDNAQGTHKSGGQYAPS